MRSAKEFTRIYGSKARVAWIQAMPSVVSGRGPCVNAHTESGGMGRKADHHTIVPLTDAEHRELHQIGVRSFERKYRVDLKALARAVHHRWLTLHGGQDGKYGDRIPQDTGDDRAGASPGCAVEGTAPLRGAGDVPQGRGIPCCDSSGSWD